MAIDATGGINALTPLNRQDTPASQNQPAGAQTAPASGDSERAQRPADVQVDTRIGQRQADNRARIQQASDLAVAQQDRGEVLERLRAEREQLSDEAGTRGEGDRARLSEAVVEDLQRIRALALEDPFGNGPQDSGPLAADGFFTLDREAGIEALDQSISALERLQTADADRLEALREDFNTSQDAALSEGNPPFENGEDAGQAATELARQIRQETPLDLYGLSADDRSNVLSALQA